MISFFTLFICWCIWTFVGFIGAISNFKPGTSQDVINSFLMGCFLALLIGFFMLYIK
jgi:hypothetical protein